MSSSTRGSTVKDATERLVAALASGDKARALSRAKLILKSTNGKSSSASQNQGAWNRIQRAVPDAVGEIKEQYQQIEDNPDAESILTVLSKLVFNQNTFQEELPMEYELDENAPLQERIARLREEETLLLREVTYALQGIDGKHVFFVEEMDDEDLWGGIRIRPSPLFEINDPDLLIGSRLGSGAKQAIKIIGEAGWFYLRVKHYVDQKPQGVVSQAFSVALSKELRHYHAFVASMDAKLEDSSYCLRQLLLDVHGPTTRLKTLAMLSDGLSAFQGAPLLSALHQHSIHGDTRHSRLVQELVYDAARPWFEMLYLWTMKGTLKDFRDEFFVVQNENVQDKHMWQNRFQLNRDRIPLGIIERDLVRPSFNVGRGINFIRSCLHDSEWNLLIQEEGDDDDDDSPNEIRLGYHYFHTASRRARGSHTSPLHRTLAQAARQVQSHILHSLFEEHHLIQHLWALKQFLLLGQGDFITALMDDLVHEFDNRNGIVGIYKHSLMAILDRALQSTNAAALPRYTLERLYVELLLSEDDDARYRIVDNKEDDEDDVRTGWDIFMLSYTVPDPLVAIVHPRAMSLYKVVFQMLFRVKRVEYMLNTTWRQGADLQHELFKYAQKLESSTFLKNPHYVRVTMLLRKVSMARQSMLHFVGNLQSYLMFEVLEGGWKELINQIKTAETLDRVIEVHDKYLDAIVQKCFLRGELGLLNTQRDLQDKELATEFENLLDLARTFCTLQQSIFNDAMQALQTAREELQEASERVSEGGWGFEIEQSSQTDEHLQVLLDEANVLKVVRVAEEFDDLLLNALRGLNETLNSGGQYDSPFATSTDPKTPGPVKRPEAPTNVDHLDALQFLTFQLDYSNYYSTSDQ